MANERQGLVAPKISAGGVIPLGAKIGDRLFSSSIPGTDPTTGRLGDGPERQFALAFQNLRGLMEQAGGSMDNIGHVTAFVKGHEYRRFLDESWREGFPDAEDCPARKVTVVDLPGDVLVQLQAFAVLGERRQLLTNGSVRHREPRLPLAVRVGDMVYSSAIGGQDPRTGKNVQGAEGQMAQTLENMEALMEAAGGSMADIVHSWVFLKDYAHWGLSFAGWVDVFPGEGNLPARKTITPRTAAYDLLGDTEVQVQFIAALGGGRRNYEVEGLSGHRDPVPLGARVGSVLYSSGIPGSARHGGGPGEGMERQAELAFENMEALVETAGGSTANIAHVTILTTEFGYEAALERVWRKMFPDLARSPACHAMKWGTSGNTMFQVHFAAVF
jgi:2-iminobutanoate/2-iminopropanoate deaminase